MNNIKKFFEFADAQNTENIENTEVSEEKYTDIKDDLKEKISNSLKSSDDNVIKEFITSIIKNPNDNKIEGLVNDSDIYEFYLKWKNDIDEILSDNRYYDDIPSEKNIFSLYDYLIDGTNKAIVSVLEMTNK